MIKTRKKERKEEYICTYARPFFFSFSLQKKNNNKLNNVIIEGKRTQLATNAELEKRNCQLDE